MECYLNRHTQAGTVLFDVYDTGGTLLYFAEGEWGTFGGKLYLRSANGEECAKISCVGIHGLCKYSITVGEKEWMRVTQNMAAGQELKLSKTDLVLRGDPAARCFDLVDEGGKVRMTHAPCWSAMGDGYGIHIEYPQDVPVCLCLAVIIDSAALCGPGCVVPAN